MLSFITSIIDGSKVGGYVRAGVAAALGFISTKYLANTFLAGVLSPDVINSIALAASTLAVGYWSQLTKSPTQIVKQAEALPEVKKIEVTAASGIAAPSVTGPKVVS
jgi:hypothetical protein